MGHTGYINTVTVSPDGSLCASGGKARPPWTACTLIFIIMARSAAFAYFGSGAGSWAALPVNQLEWLCQLLALCQAVLALSPLSNR